MESLKRPLGILLLLLFAGPVLAQEPSGRVEFNLKGKVVAGEREYALSGIEVRTDKGAVTFTDGLGEFSIRAAAGDLLIVSGADINTVRYRIKDDEEVKVVIEGADAAAASRSSISRNSGPLQHRSLLDSANYYKETDIVRSLDFVTRSIELLNDRSNRRDLARSLATLGEIYQYHGQLDLAVDNYRESLETYEALSTRLKLARALVLNERYSDAEEVLGSRLAQNGVNPEQRVEGYEILGDANKGMGLINPAVNYYNQALTIADKNQMAQKVTDLNSRIADAYDTADRTVEAEAFYGNSLRQAKAQDPAREVQESEKVADFYNKRSRYPEEIALRKQSLERLRAMESPVEARTEGPQTDSITVQEVNYKIGRAYLAQDRQEEAIPFLAESIKEASSQGDLVVEKDATRRLSEVYRNRGDFEKALELYQQYVALVDTLYIRKEQELGQAARFSSELASRQSRINSLEQERELSQSKYDLALAEQRLVQEINKRQQYIIYSLIFGLILTGLAAFFYYRSNRQKELANHLLALKGLRTQMNPHFIFNALNSVNHYIARNDERSANRYLNDFSRLMRTVLDNSERDFIPLTEEVELLELYLKLEHARFPDKFEYAVEVDPHLDLEAFSIPPMLLQPYVENAVWHGLRYKEEKGRLEVRIGPESPGVLRIEISDDGIGRKQSAAVKTRNQQRQKSKGMGNIRKRIEILNRMYGDRIAANVTDLNEDGTGTKVVLTLKNS